MLVEILAIALTYANSHPVRWLIVLTVIGELLTTLPFGTMTLVIFLPFIIARFLKKAVIWALASFALQTVIVIIAVWLYGR